MPHAPQPPASVNPSTDAATPTAHAGPEAPLPSGAFGLRRPIPLWESIVLGLLCILVCLLVWGMVTRGEPEERIVGPLTLPSPTETLSAVGRLMGDNLDLIYNIGATLRRVALGFLLAVAIGVPLGILAGCFPRINAFLTPVIMFGRNIPIAALLPLLILVVRSDFIFSATEQRKILFIFVASVSFIIADSARAIMEVAQRYVDTAYTLGASRWQTIKKVLVPLAAPMIFSSCRLMFGIAFGYIMLAESIKEAGGAGGLGYQIQIAQRRGDRESIYLIILIIPLLALVIDQLLYWMQRSLFPYQYPSKGLLHHALRGLMHLWDDAKRLVLGSRISDEFLARHYPAVQAADVQLASAASAGEVASSAPAPAASGPETSPPAGDSATSSPKNKP